jgi:hypothetical protein
MCLIIDATFVHHVHPTPDENGTPVREALLAGTARLVYGGQLSREYRDGSLEFRRWLVLLDRAGLARKVPDDQVDDITGKLVAASTCVSNDAHIIALAQVGRVRLLCSSDADLHTDFTNHGLLSPRGSVYQRAEHKHLIADHCGGVAQQRSPPKRRRRRRRAQRRRGSR